MNVFLDESGSLGFSSGGSGYFIITALYIPKNQSKRLKKAIEKYNAYLIRSGWPRNLEIKATTLFNCQNQCYNIPQSFFYYNNPEDGIIYVLEKIKNINIIIDYIVINLLGVNSNLRKLDKPILYNFFARRLLERRLPSYESVNLYVDQRDPEYHHMLKFNGYIETQMKIKSAHRGIKLNLGIEHVLSHQTKGIQAVDFCCWAIKRKYGNNDERFLNVISSKTGEKLRWFF